MSIIPFSLFDSPMFYEYVMSNYTYNTYIQFKFIYCEKQCQYN
jgi:hypothetical protein